MTMDSVGANDTLQSIEDRTAMRTSKIITPGRVKVASGSKDLAPPFDGILMKAMSGHGQGSASTCILMTMMTEYVD